MLNLITPNLHNSHLLRTFFELQFCGRIWPESNCQFSSSSVRLFSNYFKKASGQSFVCWMCHHIPHSSDSFCSKIPKKILKFPNFPLIPFPSIIGHASFRAISASHYYFFLTIPPDLWSPLCGHANSFYSNLFHFCLAHLSRPL